MPVNACCCGPIYYKLRKCSDGTLVDIGMTTETVLALSLTSANSIKYSNVCYFLNSTTTTTRPGTVLAAGDVTVYDCCLKCNGGPACCTACTRQQITVAFDGVTICPCQSLTPGVSHLVTGTLDGVYTLAIAGDGSPIYPGACRYELNSTGPLTLTYYNGTTCTGTVIITLSNVHLTVYLGPTQAIVKVTVGGQSVFDGTASATCDGGEVTNSLNDCAGTFGSGGTATIV